MTEEGPPHSSETDDAIDEYFNSDPTPIKPHSLVFHADPDNPGAAVRIGFAYKNDNDELSFSLYRLSSKQARLAVRMLSWLTRG